MKRAVLVLALAGLVLGMAGQASAQEEQSTIQVNVSWGTVSVSCGPTPWEILNVALGSTTASPTFTCTNNGSLPLDFGIAGTDAAGGWRIGSLPAPPDPPVADVFQVTVTGGNFGTATPLTTSSQSLATGVAANGGSETFDLIYTAAATDNTGNQDQSFQVNVSATASQ